MKKITLLVIGIIFSVNGFSQVTFQKTYQAAPPLYDRRTIQQTTDGGYIIANGYLMKTDFNGNILWKKSYADLDANCAQQTTDGGYITVGSTATFAAGVHDVYLVRTNSSGDTLWTKTYGGAGWDIGFSVQQTADGGFIISGATDSYTTSINVTDVYLIKTDSSGNVTWAKTYDGGISDDDLGFSVQQTADGGYIVGGFTGTQIMFPDACVWKTDSNGNLVWTKSIEGAVHDYGFEVQQTTDGGYIVAGFTAPFSASYTDMYLVKLDGSGSMSWSKIFGDADTTISDRAYSVHQTTDGGYILAGNRRYSSFATYVYIVKANSLGNLQWSKTYEGAGTFSEAYCVRQTTDGGYIILGKDDNSLYLVKTNSTGTSGCNESSAFSMETIPATQITDPSTVTQSVNCIVTSPVATIISGGTATTLCFSNPTGISLKQETLNTISISPNPAINQLTIYFEATDGEMKIETIEIFNTLGEKVYDNAETSGTNAETINVSKLSCGIYFVRVKTSEGMMAGKFVKE